MSVMLYFVFNVVFIFCNRTNASRQAHDIGSDQVQISINKMLTLSNLKCT